MSLQQQELKQLAQKKDEIEKEITELVEYLNISGFGLSGNLVDKDGFPLNDVDKILSVRNARNRIACLQTDHLNLMKQIEQKLFTKSNTTQTKDTPIEQKEPPISPSISVNEPFVVVDQMEPHSPAQEAALVLGDEIIQFGNITKQTENPLQGIANMVRNAEGKQISIYVKRKEGQQTTIKSLVLQPRRWAPNKGLLGLVETIHCADIVDAILPLSKITLEMLELIILNANW